MILSIVVPAYNVEKYIERCLDSIVNQSSHSADYEVIIINDGSTDNTLDVIKRYEKNYSHIILINRQNQGLSVARNNGMKEAKGDYVWFVDSDDWINEDAINEIRKAASSHPDVIALNYTSCGENVTASESTSFSSKQLSCADGISLLKEGFKIQAQFYIYNRLYLNKHNLRFYPGIYHEDMEFTPRMLYFAESISFIDKPIYYFYKRSNSITTTVNPKRSFDYIQVADNLISFVNSHNSIDEFLRNTQSIFFA